MFISMPTTWRRKIRSPALDTSQRIPLELCDTEKPYGLVRVNSPKPAESESRPRTSPGGIAPLGRGGASSQARPEDLPLHRHRGPPSRRALEQQGWTELPPPDQVPALPDSSDRLRGGEAEEAAIAPILGQPPELRRGREGGGAWQHSRLHDRLESWDCQSEWGRESRDWEIKCSAWVCALCYYSPPKIFYVASRGGFLLPAGRSCQRSVKVFNHSKWTAKMTGCTIVIVSRRVDWTPMISSWR